MGAVVEGERYAVFDGARETEALRRIGVDGCEHVAEHERMIAGLRGSRQGESRCADLAVAITSSVTDCSANVVILPKVRKDPTPGWGRCLSSQQGSIRA